MAAQRAELSAVTDPDKPRRGGISPRSLTSAAVCAERDLLATMRAEIAAEPIRFRRMPLLRQVRRLAGQRRAESSARHRGDGIYGWRAELERASPAYGKTLAFPHHKHELAPGLVRRRRLLVETACQSRSVACRAASADSLTSYFAVDPPAFSCRYAPARCSA